MEGKGFSQRFNPLLLFNLLLSLIGIYWGLTQGDNASYIYFNLIMLSIVIISLIGLFYRKDESLDDMHKFIKVPFTTNLGVASFLYLAGWGVPIIINFFIKLFSSFSITSFSIPLSAVGSGTPLTFQAGSISQSSVWEVFNIVFVAGNWETFVFSFIAILVGGFLARIVYKFFNNPKIKEKTFIMLGGIIFASATFVFMHQLNGSYSGANFVMALAFITLSNISIYYGGVFLTFWAGYHQSNNLLYLLQIKGFPYVFSSFISLFGLFFFIYMLLIIGYVLYNWKDIKPRVTFKKLLFP